MQLNQALEQLREIKARVVEAQLFRGYSSKARLAGGVLAFLSAVIMSTPWFPGDVAWHVLGWGSVCAAAMVLNFGALLLWFLRLHSGQRKLHMLRPVLDVLPPLVLGAILTSALLSRQQYDLLFGTWMCCYGLVNAGSRHSQPQEIFVLGWYYILAGVLMLGMFSELPFTNPWPMGVVFALGETAGALIFKSTQHVERG